MIEALDLAPAYGFVAKRDSLERVASARRWAEFADRSVRSSVAESRSLDVPWEEIADALGMTAALAEARYGQ